MRIRQFARPVAIISLAITLVLGTISASATPGSSNSKNDVAAFWTADRIKRAIPFDMVFEPGASVAKRVPAAKGSGKPSGGSGTSVKGASWTKAGLPLTATGKVFFAIGSSYYQCSGALVRDGKADRSVVLTAGHCLYDNATQVFATNWIFIPSYDVNQVLISGCESSDVCWEAESLHAHPGFTEETGFTTEATLHDWGFATITETKASLFPDGGNGSEDGTNSFILEIESLEQSAQVSSFGYPASGKYKGKDLVYSSGKISFDPYNNNQTYSLVSDMTGGCSGGPWLSSMATSGDYSGILSSVNSYKYGTSAFIYGPKFNSKTQETYDLALVTNLLAN